MGLLVRLTVYSFRLPFQKDIYHSQQSISQSPISTLRNNGDNLGKDDLVLPKVHHTYLQNGGTLTLLLELVSRSVGKLVDILCYGHRYLLLSFVYFSIL